MRFKIYKCIKIGDKWRYCPAVLDRGMPVKDLVLVGDAPAVDPEGAYYVGKDSQWIKAGDTPQDVIDCMLRLATPGEPEAEKPKLWQQAMR